MHEDILAILRKTLQGSRYGEWYALGSCGEQQRLPSKPVVLGDKINSAASRSGVPILD